MLINLTSLPRRWPTEIDDARLATLVSTHGTDGYRLYLEELRWPGGVHCPRCEATDTLFLEARSKHHCRGCKLQFRVTAGTLLHDTHVPLDRWLLAVALFVAAPRGLPATHLQQSLGGSYKTSWYVEHRIRAALAGSERDLGPVVALADPPPAPAEAGTPVDAPPGWSLLQRVVAGPYRRTSTKYLSAYWSEAQWRLAHGRTFRAVVLALLTQPPLTYERLVRHPATS